MQPSSRPDSWPTLDWEVASPEAASAAGFDSEAVARLAEYARTSYPQIRAVVIVRHGQIVFEAYFDECDQRSYHAVYSVTKSVVSALVGILLRDGHLDSLDQRVLEILSEYDRPGLDPRTRELTVGHLLTMTSGFAHEHNVTPFPRDSADLAEHALGRRLASHPGSVFRYDDISIQLLSVIITRLTGLSAAAFAQRELFGPLGIWAGEQARSVWKGDLAATSTFHPYGDWPDDGLAWKVDRQGYSYAGFGLHLTAREMAKFGYLYLKTGRWDGQQIIPAYYVRASVGYRKFIVPNVGRPYGLLWWMGRYGSFRAAGLWGQFIHVRPRQDLVMAITVRPSRNSSERMLNLVGRLVVPELME